MSNWLLIPGMGGRATTPAATTASLVTDADGSTYIVDCSRCTGLTFQQTAAAGVGGTFQLLESFDGSNFDLLGAPINVQSGMIQRLEADTRPFGRIEIDATNVSGLSASATLTMVIFGQAIGSGLF